MKPSNQQPKYKRLSPEDFMQMPKWRRTNTMFQKSDEEKAQLFLLKKEINKANKEAFGTKRPGNKQFTHIIKAS